MANGQVEGSFVAKVPEGTPHSYLKSLVGAKVQGGRRACTDKTRDSSGYVRMGSMPRNSLTPQGSSNFNQSGSVHVSYAKPENNSMPSTRFSRSNSNENAKTASKQTFRPIPSKPNPPDFSSVRFSSQTLNSNNNEAHLQRLERRVSIAADDWTPPGEEEELEETDEELQHLLKKPTHSNLASRMQVIEDRPSRDSVHSFDSYL